MTYESLPKVLLSGRTRGIGGYLRGKFFDLDDVTGDEFERFR
jgi:hypothetical protein